MEEEGGERKEGGRGELRSSLTCPCGGFLGGRVVKNPPAKGRDTDLIRGLGKSTGEGNDNPL